jgi:hypothetical protein
VYVDFPAQNQDFVLGKRSFTVELENPKIHMKIFNRSATLFIPCNGRLFEVTRIRNSGRHENRN